MIRTLVAVVIIGFLGANLAACDKPSETDCKNAIRNIRKIVGTDKDDKSNIAAAVRSCQGNATKTTVQCIIDAKDEAGLSACEGGIFDEMFKDVPAPKTGDKPAPKADDVPAPKAADKAAPTADDTAAPTADDTAAPKADDTPADKPAPKAADKPAPK